MPEEQSSCKKPEKLKGEHGECAPEQVRECHPQAVVHECEEPVKESREKRSCCCRS